MNRTYYTVNVFGKNTEKDYTVNDEITINENQDPVCEAFRKNAKLRGCDMVATRVMGKRVESIETFNRATRKDIPYGGMKFDFREVNPDV